MSDASSTEAESRATEESQSEDPISGGLSFPDMGAADPLPTTAEDDPVGYITTDEELVVRRKQNHQISVVVTREDRDLRAGDFVQLPVASPDNPPDIVDLLCRVDEIEYVPSGVLDARPDVLAEIEPNSAENERRHSCIARLSTVSSVEFERRDDDVHPRGKASGELRTATRARLRRR